MFNLFIFFTEYYRMASKAISEQNVKRTGVKKYVKEIVWKSDVVYYRLNFQRFTSTPMTATCYYFTHQTQPHLELLLCKVTRQVSRASPEVKCQYFHQ